MERLAFPYVIGRGDRRCLAFGILRAEHERRQSRRREFRRQTFDSFHHGVFIPCFQREVQQKIFMRSGASHCGNGSYNRIQFISRHFPEFKSFKSLFHPIFLAVKIVLYISSPFSSVNLFPHNFALLIISSIIFILHFLL